MKLLQSNATITVMTVATFRYTASPNQHHDRCTITTELANLFVEKNKLSYNNKENKQKDLTERTMELLQSKATITVMMVAIFRYTASPNQHHDRCSIPTELVNLFVKKNKVS